MAAEASKVSEKFANLPAEDLDTTGPDVFETADVPGALNAESTDEEDDEFGTHGAVSHHPVNREDLLTNSLDPSTARARFKGQYLQAGDFSAKLTRRYPPQLPESRIYEYLPHGYASSSSNTRNGPQQGNEETETSLARLRRLKLEMDELEEQLQQPQDPSSDSVIEGDAVSPAILLNQLRMLKGDWTRLNEPPSKAAQTVPEHPSSAASEPEPSTSARPQASTAHTMEPSFSKLTEQVGSLERLLGAPASADLPPPVLPALDKLSHQLSLLSQPRHLDTLSRRIKTLVSDLERIHETRRKLGDTTPLHLALSSGLTVSTPGEEESAHSGEADKTAAAATGSAEDRELPPDILPRLQALFQLLPRLQALLPLTPGLLLRLRSLADLHASASTFGASLHEAQESVATMEESYKGLQTVLSNVQSSLEGNQKAMNANLDSIQERVASLDARVQALQS